MIVTENTSKSSYEHQIMLTADDFKCVAPLCQATYSIQHMA